MSLYVTYAHPNPVGKDRARTQPPTNAKLNEEWVQFANIGSSAVNMTGVSLHDRTFDQRCSATGERQLQTFEGSLSVGRSVRMHTGSGSPYNEGTVRHLYLERNNYVWNNACGDEVILRRGATLLDWAGYDPNPPEGTVLRRIKGTNRLA
jgi:hypothetical protein